MSNIVSVVDKLSLLPAIPGVFMLLGHLHIMKVLIVEDKQEQGGNKQRPMLALSSLLIEEESRSRQSCKSGHVGQRREKAFEGQMSIV